MANTTSAGQKRKASSKASRASHKTAPRASGPEKSTPGTSRRTSDTAEGRSAAQGLHMHKAHASIPLPYVTPGDLSANVRAAGESILPDMSLPSPERLAFYGGLGALALVGAVEWPVAAAIGAATVVARRGKREKA
ncbi:hypothetical protein OG900_04480 [Streptomyces sp. NBC_00433]